MRQLFLSRSDLFEEYGRGGADQLDDAAPGVYDEW